MDFIESNIFTRLVLELLSDEEYRLLQTSLMLLPEQGAIIRGSGGLRKMRWPLPGRGKSGGARVIYYLPGKDRILMIFIYEKAKQEDLTLDQLKRLRRLIETE